MKILENKFPLHKLYGFLLLNTSLFVFIPFSMITYTELDSSEWELVPALILSLLGIILSALFIMRLKVAIHLLSWFLVVSICAVVVYMIIALYVNRMYFSFSEVLFIVWGFGFFLVEGIIGLLILHSDKLSTEFDNFR